MESTSGERPYAPIRETSVGVQLRIQRNGGWYGRIILCIFAKDFVKNKLVNNGSYEQSYSSGGLKF